MARFILWANSGATANVALAPLPSYWLAGAGCFMACGGVESDPRPFVPFLAGSGLTPRLAFVFGSSDIDRERNAFPVVFGGEVVSFRRGHML